MKGWVTMALIVAGVVIAIIAFIRLSVKPNVFLTAFMSMAFSGGYSLSRAQGRQRHGGQAV
jgi:hypothetical protein